MNPKSSCKGGRDLERSVPRPAIFAEAAKVLDTTTTLRVLHICYVGLMIRISDSEVVGFMCGKILGICFCDVEVIFRS